MLLAFIDNLLYPSGLSLWDSFNELSKRYSRCTDDLVKPSFPTISMISFRMSSTRAGLAERSQIAFEIKSLDVSSEASASVSCNVVKSYEQPLLASMTHSRAFVSESGPIFLWSRGFRYVSTSWSCVRTDRQIGLNRETRHLIGIGHRRNSWAAIKVFSRNSNIKFSQCWSLHRSSSPRNTRHTICATIWLAVYLRLTWCHSALKLEISRRYHNVRRIWGGRAYRFVQSSDDPGPTLFHWKADRRVWLWVRVSIKC